MEQKREMDAHISIAEQELMSKLCSLSEKPSAGFKIRKVPDRLRTENVKAYEPQIIAIGPLNRHLLDNKTHLAEMEKHKVLYLEMLLHRSGQRPSNLRRYCVTMGELQERALCCYAEPIKIARHEFVEMLLLDGCFIVEQFRMSKIDLRDDYYNVFRTRWALKKLGRDLLLAENQLPLFVLQKFYDITKMPEDRETDFQELIFGFFSEVLPVPNFGPILDLDPKINHLLGLIFDYFGRMVPLFVPSRYRENWNLITSATNLKEAGIKFERIVGESLWSIDFDRDAGILKVPTLIIDDNTESFFRNISAYGQFIPTAAYAPLINYLKFMDCLIDTAKDVELLCENKILHNCLGDGEVVANMFNRLGDSLALPLNNFYGYIFHNVNEYCDSHCNKWIANLRLNYFNTPWAIISVFAALFLLIRTLTQTVFSVLAYFQ